MLAVNTQIQPPTPHPHPLAFPHLLDGLVLVSRKQVVKLVVVNHLVDLVVVNVLVMQGGSREKSM